MSDYSLAKQFSLMCAAHHKRHGLPAIKPLCVAVTHAKKASLSKSARPTDVISHMVSKATICAGVRR